METITKASQISKGAAAKAHARSYAQKTEAEKAAKPAAAAIELPLEVPSPKANPKVWRFDDKDRPADAVFCGRPTKYGNPYPLGTPAQRRWKYEAYLEWLIFDKRILFMELAGKDLWCFCAPNACHCDVLLKHYGHLKAVTAPVKHTAGVAESRPSYVANPAVKYLYRLETRRVKEVDFPYTGTKLNSEKFVYEFLKNVMEFDVELFITFLCDSQNRVIGIYKAVGTTNAAAVFAREVMKHALLSGATALILAHNHPSGNTSPSQDDKAITRELILAASVMGIKILDHIIMGDDGMHYSFASQGLIQKYEAETDGMKARARCGEPVPTWTSNRGFTFRSAHLNAQDEIEELENFDDAGCDDGDEMEDE